LCLADYSPSEKTPAVLEPKTTANAYVPPGQNKISTASVRTTQHFPIAPQNPPVPSELPSVLLADSESAEFEGESSLHAHTIAARDLLEQTLRNHSPVRDDPKMVAALSSLRQIVESDKVKPSKKKSKLLGLGGGRQVIYELKLPPSEIVLDILHKSKGKPDSAG
jgi:hypothetical protein